MVSSGIEPLIPALLARCLNQLGQETMRCMETSIKQDQFTKYVTWRQIVTEYLTGFLLTLRTYIKYLYVN